MDKRERAYEDYKKGLKYKEISEKYGVSLNTVKSWATRYWKNEKVATSDKKVATKTEKGCNHSSEKLQSERSRGGQFGNTNAIGNSGGGAPENNTNALKNAAYAERFWKYISEDERAMIDDTPTDEEAQLIQSLKLTEIRELRHMQMLSRYRELLEKSPDGMILKEDLKTVTEEYNVSGKLARKTKEASQTKVDAVEQMQIIEAELTRIQRVKLNIIQALAKVREDKANITAGSEQNEVQITLDWNRDD